MSVNGRPVKILRIIARLNIGGPAIHTVLLSERIGAPKYESILVTGVPDRTEGDMGYIAEDRLIDRKELSMLSRRLNPVRDLAAWWQILRLIQNERPDIVHTHTSKAGALGRSAAFAYNTAQCIVSWLTRKTYVPIYTVHTFHGHVLGGYFGQKIESLFILIERFLAHYTDRLIAVSRYVRNDLLALRIGKPAQWRIVPLGLPLKPLAVLLRQDTRSTDLRVGIVGRLVPIKNHVFLLKAVEEYLASVKGVRLRFEIVGDGYLRPFLEKKARTLGLNGHVVFTGWKREVVEIYRNLDMVCLTSLNEGTPVSIIEALAAQCPVIATDVGGVRDLMGPVRKNRDLFEQMAHGVLIRSQDTKGFCKALQYLASEPDLRRDMGLAGRDFVQRFYSDDRLVADIKTIYKEILT